MTLEQLKKERPEEITVNQTAMAIKMHPQTLRLWLREGTCPFGVAIKRKRWVYKIFTERLIKYLEAQDLTA